MARGYLRRSIIFLIISIIMIIVGALLTISIIFIAVGIPVLIVGVILLILSIISFFSAFLWNILYAIRNVFLFFRPKKQQAYTREHKTTRKIAQNKKIIDVHEKEGVFEAEQ